MEIKLTAHGDKEPIPEIKDGAFIKLIGPNGIGKTTAADFLEIAFGDYNFKDKGFNNIKNAFTDCNIKIITKDERYEITLTPGTWKYIDSEFKIEEDSIGNCLHNGKRVKPIELRKLVYVKIIRGDEDLEKQIELVSSMFNVILKNNLSDALNYINALETYLKNFEIETKLDLIKKYETLQKNYIKIEINHQDRKLEYDKLYKKLETNVIILDLINKILIWEENDPEELKKQLEKIKKDIVYYEKKDRNLILEREKLAKTLKLINKKQTDELKTIFSELQNVRRNTSQIIRKIKTDFPHEWQNIQNAINNKYIEIYQEKKLKRLEELQNLLDEIQKGSDKLNEMLIIKFKLILKILDECKEDGLGDKFILEITLNGKELKLSIEKFRYYLNEKIDVLNSDPEIEKIKAQRDEIGRIFIAENKIKEVLDKLNKVMNKENDLISKKTKLTKNITIDKFMEPQLERNLRRIDKLIDDESQIRNHIDQLKIERIDIEEKLSTTKNLEPLGELRKRVVDVLPESPFDLVNKKEELNEKLSKDKETLLIVKSKLDELTKELLELEQEIIKIRNEIMVNAKSFGYIDFSKWLDYVENHIKTTQDLVNDLIHLKDNIDGLVKTFTKIELNQPFTKKERDNYIMELVSDIYNKYFLNAYKDEEFFKYVFKGYKGIKQFDVINKVIIFIKENNKLDERKLKEFSSGEKAYAFIRAMILLSKKKSKNNILIVDEAYALMDYMRSGDLTEFQKDLIHNGSYDKIINILPMRIDPEELEEQYFSEYNNLGYYHELIED